MKSKKGESPMTTTALTYARTIVRQLTIQEKLYLLNDITAQLVQAATSNPVTARPSFPVFHVAEWPTDMPMRREDLYNDRGR
jgi:hypothetical protein